MADRESITSEDFVKVDNSKNIPPTSLPIPETSHSEGRALSPLTPRSATITDLGGTGGGLLSPLRPPDAVSPVSSPRGHTASKVTGSKVTGSEVGLSDDQQYLPYYVDDLFMEDDMELVEVDDKNLYDGLDSDQGENGGSHAVRKDGAMSPERNRQRAGSYDAGGKVRLRRRDSEDSSDGDGPVSPSRSPRKSPNERRSSRGAKRPARRKAGSDVPQGDNSESHAEDDSLREESEGGDRCGGAGSPGSDIPGVESPSDPAERVLEERGAAVSSPGKATLDATGHDQEYTIFHGVTYLGSATVNAPRSQQEILRNMAVMNEHSQEAMHVSFMLPATAEGVVRLCEPNTDIEICSYKLHRIIICDRGKTASAERNCFAFTYSHSDSLEADIFQCHVFRCDLADAVGKILYYFSTFFRRNLRRGNSVQTRSEDNLFPFVVTVEIKEEDSKGNTGTVPYEKDYFKLKKGVNKVVVININQLANRELVIERCFGMLLCPGRNIKHSDMHLLDMISMGFSDSGSRSYCVSGEWRASDPNFEVINTETSKETKVFVTLAVDLVIGGIREPVRFCVESRCRIYPRTERFWYFSRKLHTERLHLSLKEVGFDSNQEPQYELASLVSGAQMERQLKAKPPPPPTAEDEEESDEDVVISGSGAVSKDITDDVEDLLQEWSQVLPHWTGGSSTTPSSAVTNGSSSVGSSLSAAQWQRRVVALCAKGIPEALRGEVWQRLTGVHEHKELLDDYRILISKESPCEQVIKRDLHRTFPAHEFFQERGGSGQEALYKITKAYSVYDAEVGYCQGLSFVVASLILHMPEEQAFAVLVQLMFKYQLRYFYKDGFEDLHLRFHQLNRLIQDMMPDMYSHFTDMALEPHMYASQWFLTVFTAKFPLYVAYHVLDLFMCNGINTIFAIAIALLKDSRRDLLSHDFEGVLKYFRVTLPKKYRNEKASKNLFETVAKTKISEKKLKKYAKEFARLSQIAGAGAVSQPDEDPVAALETRCKALLQHNLRLESENDQLARLYADGPGLLRAELERKRAEVRIAQRGTLMARAQLDEVVEEKARLEEESHQLKQIYRSESTRTETESKQSQDIIGEYKGIVKQLSEKLEKRAADSKAQLDKFKEVMSECPTCSDAIRIYVSPRQPTPLTDSDRKIRQLEMELARTKLELVQSECRNQELTHELGAAAWSAEGSTAVAAGAGQAGGGSLGARGNNWLHKSISSIRDVVKK